MLSDPVHAQETETETRLREVEAMMQKMTRELEALKLQVTTEHEHAQDARADSKDVTARLVYNFARLFDTPDSVLHFGVLYKGGTETNSTANPFSAPGARTEARGLTFFTPAAFNTATGRSENIDRSMYAFEAAVSRVLLDVVTTHFYSPVSVNGITIRKEQAVMGRYQIDF